MNRYQWNVGGVIVILNLLTSLLGYHQVVASEKLPTEEAPFNIILKPNDPPEFKRIYTAPLPHGMSLIITMYTSSIIGRTDMYGELRQANGKWVLYDVKNIADKILDRELLPIVEKLTHQALALDKTFTRHPPDEFTDSTGQVWRRVSK